MIEKQYQYMISQVGSLIIFEGIGEGNRGWKGSRRRLLAIVMIHSFTQVAVACVFSL